MSIPRRLISKCDEVFRGDKDFSRSPLRHLLKSNAIPSDSEVIVIRALITEARASVEELHRRFPTLDHASQVIESQLLEFIETHRALLSPVRYLPSEILQEIFLHYADNRGHDVRIDTMPWCLGHISHRWRKIALSLPSLWDNIPTIYLSEAGLRRSSRRNRSHARALICLLRRSGTSPTLKLNFSLTFESHRKYYESPTSIMKNIMLHSERIEQLSIVVDKTITTLLQGFKGRLPNLRILRLLYSVAAPNIDVFETAPALRQITFGGYYLDGRDSVFPWSQITHFEDERIGRVGKLLPSSSLCSLKKLDIYRPLRHHVGENALLSPYRPTILPNLRTLRVIIYHPYYRDIDHFLEYLTIPAVEVVKIRYMRPLIPHLVSMFSGLRAPYRLQKLAFRTIPLQTGELSALLKLTPHLVELDIDVPPASDLLRLIYNDGEVMLVPMLQALYIHIPALTTAQIDHLNTLAQVRCELGIRVDLEGGSMLSQRPGTWTPLHTLQLFFDSPYCRDGSQKTLNNWSSSFTLEEAYTIDMLGLEQDSESQYICNGSFDENILSFSECHEITSKVLRVGVFFWMLAC